jgi:hypothetical protein
MSIISAQNGNSVLNLPSGASSASMQGTVTTTTAAIPMNPVTVHNSTGYASTEANSIYATATKQDISNLMKYFNSILTGMVLLSNETEETKQVLTVEEGFTMFAKYQNLGHKVTVTMLSEEAAKVLYGAK